MATLSSDGQYVTVQKGDCLWNIAAKYLGSGSKYTKLASINNLSNPSLIYVGQKIYLYSKSGSSGSSGSSSTSTSTLTITAFGYQSDSNGTLFATWTCTRSKIDKYEVIWYYHTGDGVWFVGSDNTTEYEQSTYNIPSNATKVYMKVKAVSKTYTSNSKTTSYWTDDWHKSDTYYVTSNPPSQPSTPSVEIDNYTLTAELDNLNTDDMNADQIQFQVVKNNVSVFKTVTATISYAHVSMSCSVTAGNEYKVRCRSYNSTNDEYSDWSEYSDNIGTGPAAPDSITSLKALSSTSIQIEWSSVANADEYTIEYTTKETYFDASSGNVSSITVDSTVSYAIITGLDSGYEYFFRVKASNDQGESVWTDISSVVVGKAPTAPTTWSSTTTAIVGEIVTLYWVHNAQDGSNQTYAELELTVDGEVNTYTIKAKEVAEDEEVENSTYEIDTSDYSEGTTIQWRVRTAGIFGPSVGSYTYGEWSVQRTIDVYAPATLELSITDIDGNAIETVESFPIYVYGLPGPKTQAPISYHLSVVSNEEYETTDSVGNVVTVTQNEEVYSKSFDITSELLVELSADNINLDNTISYTVSCTVAMNSGLSVEESLTINVNWTDVAYSPNASVAVDQEPCVTYIRPYCEQVSSSYYKVELDGTEYVRSEEVLDIDTISDVYADETGEMVQLGKTSDVILYGIAYFDNEGNAIDSTYYEISESWGVYQTGDILDSSTITDVYTTTSEKVLLGINSEGDVIYYCEMSVSELVEDVTLAVYRREFDGSFTEIAKGISNTRETYVTDPHPSLDYARYRIVATAIDTGAISFTDLPAYPIGEKSVILQWDEDWKYFDVTNEDEMAEPPWSGSLLRLPYNIDVSDSHSSDVSLVEYIGRKHPVSYYGTQLGESATWNVEIDKTDKDTLYALRRLRIWMGDVYVREPSGSGYWANVEVSFSQKHKDLTIPVSLKLVRVEGGL